MLSSARWARYVYIAEYETSGENTLVDLFVSTLRTKQANIDSKTSWSVPKTVLYNVIVACWS